LIIILINGTEKFMAQQDGAIVNNQAVTTEGTGDGGAHTGGSHRSDPGWWAIALIVLFAGAILIAIGVDAPALSRLSDPAYARGLITWLIVLTAIGLAFILVYQAFNNSGQSEEGFRRGREVFAGLMGIVGTIVGFYFGSADKTLGTLSLADPIQDGIAITTFVSGGTPPYRYTVTVDSSEKTLAKDPEKVRTADTGWIKFDLSNPPAGAANLTISLTDAKEQRVSKKFTVKASNEIITPAKTGASAPASKPPETAPSK
jgi:hypothetical protein